MAASQEEESVGERCVGGSGRCRCQASAARRSLPVILWDTSGLLGRRDVWVVISPQDVEDITTDNQANRTLALVRHWLYLPGAVRE